MCKVNTINIHFLDACNYVCHHCFVKKESNQLNFEQITVIVDKIYDYFIEEDIQDGRINLAGGEPLLSKDIDKIIEYIFNKGIKVSIITNGFYLTKKFIDRHVNQLCCIGISVDSLKLSTNQRIGRCQKDGKSIGVKQLIDICKYVKHSGIKLKINTCVSKLNYQEDFRSFLEQVRPDRYKVLQMLCDDYDIVNVSNRINDSQMNEFVELHKEFISVKETAKELKKSYLIVDSQGNLTYNNSHNLTYSIFDNKVSNILEQLKLNEQDFERRYNNEYQHRIINQQF